MDFEGISSIGKITRSHGVRGEVKVVLDTEHPEIFSNLDCCHLIYKNNKKTVRFESARPANKFWLFKFKGIEDRNSADELRDYDIFVDEELLPPLEEGEFFIHDLINSSVYSIEDEYLGKVIDYFENGEQGVCEVKGEHGNFLFPITDEIFKEIRVPEKKIIIQLIPGLTDLNRKPV